MKKNKFDIEKSQQYVEDIHFYKYWFQMIKIFFKTNKYPYLWLWLLIPFFGGPLFYILTK